MEPMSEQRKERLWRGVVLLDAKVPDWYWQVDRSKLYVADWRWCVLGQLTLGSGVRYHYPAGEDEDAVRAYYRQLTGQRFWRKKRMDESLEAHGFLDIPTQVWRDAIDNKRSEEMSTFLKPLGAELRFKLKTFYAEAPND